MAREIWKGAISFGLVNIPVNLYSGEKPNELKFSLLDRRNMAPVGYKRFNKETGKEVPWEEIVKGYEYEKDQYVVLSDEDFRRANVKATQTVDIITFIQASEIDPIYFEKPYYLTPGKKGEKGYALLREVLRQTGKIGIASLVIHTRQHVAAIIPHGNILLLELLRFANELRDPKEYDVPETDLSAIGVTKKELAMAEQLVEGMSDEWDPKSYHDDYRDDLMALVGKKIKAGQAQTISEPDADEEAPRSDNVIDLMKLLKRSVEETGKTSAKSPSPRKTGPHTKAKTPVKKRAWPGT